MKSNSNTNSNEALSKLQLNLKYFGLAPQDWKIIKKEKNTFLIQHIIDQGFNFVGESSTTDEKSWKAIKLHSL